MTITSYFPAIPQDSYVVDTNLHGYVGHDISAAVIDLSHNLLGTQKC